MKSKMDVIIVSKASNDYLKALAQQTIDTCLCSEEEGFFDIVVVEQNNCQYYGAKVIQQTGWFGYNRYLNEGAALGTSEYICFANNDLIFEQSWASNIIKAMEENNVVSACPYCPSSNVINNTGIVSGAGVYFGYDIRKEFIGWCIVWKRSFWEKVKLDEEIKFWASDNSCAEILKLEKQSHILVTDSIVHHVNNGSNTLHGIPFQEKNELMHKQIKIFNKKYNCDYFGLGKD